MATPVTECAIMTLKAGVDIEGHTPEATVWNTTLSTIEAQDGYQGCYWGLQLDNSSGLVLLIDWESLDAHKKFMATPGYEKFVSNMSSIVEDMTLRHVESKPFPPSIVSVAPCTEFATFYNVQPGFTDNVEKFAVEAGKADPEGFFGLAYGEVVEEMKKEGGEYGKAVTIWVGWQNKEAHMKFRETEDFKRIIPLLMGKSGGAEMFHVPFKTV